MKIMKSKDYHQDIICEECGVMMGYAPYYRTEYICCDCAREQEDEKKNVDPGID